MRRFRYLIQVNLVSREREPGSRRYRVHDDLWYEAIINREPLLTRWSRALEAGVEAVGSDSPAGRRLAETVEFFEFLKGEMPAMLARWRAGGHSADVLLERPSGTLRRTGQGFLPGEVV